MNEAPGREKEAERKGEEYAQRAASQLDKTVRCISVLAR